MYLHVWVVHHLIDIGKRAAIVLPPALHELQLLRLELHLEGAADKRGRERGEGRD